MPEPGRKRRRTISYIKAFIFLDEDLMVSMAKELWRREVRRDERGFWLEVVAWLEVLTCIGVVAWLRNLRMVSEDRAAPEEM